MPSLMEEPSGNEKSTIILRFFPSLGTVIMGLNFNPESGGVSKGPNISLESTLWAGLPLD